MKVTIIEEADISPALFGLGLSYGITSNLTYDQFKKSEELHNKMFKISKTLYLKGDGHNKFLESISVYLDIDAPRYWWQEFDTYRIGVTKQSESTIHTIVHSKLDQPDFEYSISPTLLNLLNTYIYERDFVALKNILPEGFLQRRIVCCNYKVLRHIITQRRCHKLREWHTFCDEIMRQIKYSYLDDLK